MFYAWKPLACHCNIMLFNDVLEFLKEKEMNEQLMV